MLTHKSLAEEFIYSLRFDFGDFQRWALNCAENFQELTDRHSDDARRAELNTHSFWLLGAFLKRAAEICDERSFDASSSEADNLFEKAYGAADHLRFLMCDVHRDQRKDDLTSIEVKKLYALRMSFDKHSPVFQQLKTKDIPGRISDDLEQYVNDYLSSPFRSSELDSVMLKILAEEEPIQYIHHVAWENPEYPNFGIKAKLTAAQDYAKQINRPIEGWLFKQVLETLAVPALLFAGAIYLNWDGIGYVALILSILWVSFSFYCAASYLRHRSDYRSEKITNTHTEVFKMTLAMEDFIRTLRSDGSISLARIEQKLKDLEQLDAVMPETLFVFIDDLKAKGITSI
jgi:hypothetical protein